MAHSKTAHQTAEAKPSQRRQADDEGRNSVRKAHADGKAGARSLGRAADDPHQAPESGEKPEVMPALSRSADRSVAADAAMDVREVYRALKRHAGREMVNDGNVASLIDLAHRDGDAQLEYLLREWRSSCGEDANAPALEDVQGLPPR